MRPEVLVFLIAVAAVWTSVVAELGKHARRQISAQSKAMLLGIVFGFLAAALLQFLEEMTEAQWLNKFQWPVGLLVWAACYVRTTYRWEKENPPPKT